FLQVGGAGRVGDDGFHPVPGVPVTLCEELRERAAQLGETARDGCFDPSDLDLGARGAELDHQHGLAVVAFGEGEGERGAGVPGGGADGAAEVLAAVEVAEGEVVDAAEHPGGHRVDAADV